MSQLKHSRLLVESAELGPCDTLEVVHAVQQDVNIVTVNVVTNKHIRIEVANHF